MRDAKILVRTDDDTAVWLETEAEQWFGGNKSAMIRRVIELGRPVYEEKKRARMSKELKT
jgi:hypothetical protein